MRNIGVTSLDDVHDADIGFLDDNEVFNGIRFTKPVLVNQETYAKIQSFLINNIAIFATIGRIENIQINFPPFSEAKKGNWYEGTAVWSATYIDDLEGVNISGSISF